MLPTDCSAASPLSQSYFHSDSLHPLFNFDASHGLLRSFAALAILLSFVFADLLRKSLPSYFYIFDTSHGLLRSFAALAILLPFGFADLLRKSLPSSWECRFQAQILFPASRNQSEFGTLEVSNSIF